MTTIQTISSLVLGMVLICQYGLAQTDMNSRVEFQQKKIKTIKRSTFSYDMQVLTDITEEHYDTLGNLIWKTNRTFKEGIYPGEISDVLSADNSNLMNFKYDYDYDEKGNKISEHLKSNFFPLNNKWEYKYDATGKMLSMTTFDLHSKPHQTRYYFYDSNGVLVKDSLVQQGEPLFITNYIYRNEKLSKKTTLWAKKVKFQLSKETAYTYNKKGLLEREVSVYNQSTDYEIGSKQTTLYFYDRNDRLVKMKIDQRTIEYYYDKMGNCIKKCDFQKLPENKQSFSKPFCETVEYEYY